MIQRGIRHSFSLRKSDTSISSASRTSPAVITPKYGWIQRRRSSRKNDPTMYRIFPGSFLKRTKKSIARGIAQLYVIVRCPIILNSNGFNMATAREKSTFFHALTPSSLKSMERTKTHSGRDRRIERLKTATA